MAATQINAIIAQTTELVIQETINIPRITVVPIGEVRSGFHPFTLSLENLNYAVPEDDLWIQTLREQEIQILKTGNSNHQEKRLEDYVIMGLVDFDDVSYDEQADLLYNLAGQIVQHLRSYLTDDEDIRKILQIHRRSISALIHTQMQPYFWETAAGYETKVNRGFNALKQPCYAVTPELIYDFRQSPPAKSNIAKYLFGGFERCLYPYQQFQSDAERVLSIILDRETQKWFKPARGQVYIYYHWQGSQPEYQPDFIAETDELIYMIEVKARYQITADDVQAKKAAAITWCEQASEYNQKHGGKVWNYFLISHDEIKENMTVKGLCSVSQRQHQVELGDETDYLLSSPRNAAHLQRSIDELRQGKILEKELIDE